MRHPLTCVIFSAAVSAGLLLGAFPAGGAPPAIAQDIGEGMVRFGAEGTPVDPGAGARSFALVAPPEVRGPAPAGWALTPDFSIVDGEQVVTLDVPEGTSLYGTGEVAGPLLRNGRQTVCWNTDAYGYDETTPSLYQSHPWVLGVRPDGSAFGVLADTTWRCEIDLSSGVVFRATEGTEPFEVIVIDRESPQAVMLALGGLIGTMPMPPLWALGYHQCRYSYYPESRVREIATGFRDRDIPCDVIWFDIDYMDGYRIFTFDKDRFPDPQGLNDDLHGQGFHTIWMIDPGVKCEEGYFVYDSGTAGDHWVKAAGGEDYVGDVWPGACVFPDFTRVQTRQWWAGLYGDFMAQGVDGVWNDMNEPAIFNVPSKTMPLDNWHRGGAEAGVKLNREPAGPHARYHNVYGMLMAMATREGIQQARPEKRPFVLTRAGYLGSQRYAATWTGDNSAEWDDLEASIPMVLNLGLSGQPFCGPDIGGFIGNGDGEMFARWMGIGALLPFSRGHTGKGNIDKEPWAFGPEVEETCRLALQRRYVLLPYTYTLFHEASQTGMPVARPVFFADAADPALRSEDDAFLIGADLLVEPFVTPDRDRAVVLPEGARNGSKWRRITLIGEGDHPDLPKLYARVGSIIPTGPVVESTNELLGDDGEGMEYPLTLIVTLDENGAAEGVLYEDAGDGLAYRTGGFRLTKYIAETNGGRLSLGVQRLGGNLAEPERPIRARVIAPDGTEETIVIAR
jgi:alpha-glucosidase